MRAATVDRVFDSLATDVEPWVAVFAVEAITVLAYFVLTPAAMTDPRYVLYPFVWINLGLFAVARVDPPTAGRRARLLAAAVAAAYVLALAFTAGLLDVSLGAHGGHSHEHIRGLQVSMSAPGWGPRIGYAAESFSAAFVPYRVVGYLALGYLLYAALLDAARAALPGVLGVATCVGCSFPLLAALGGLGGAGAAANVSVDLSTAAFVLAAALLAWRPGVS